MVVLRRASGVDVTQRTPSPGAGTRVAPRCRSRRSETVPSAATVRRVLRVAGRGRLQRDPAGHRPAALRPRAGPDARRRDRRRPLRAAAAAAGGAVLVAGARSRPRPGRPQPAGPAADGAGARPAAGPRRSSLVIDELRAIISSVADASQFLMVVTDADGIILWREGAARVRSRADGLGFAEGAEWTEELVGTNAIGTALAEASPVQLFSAEHFEADQHPWYCTAAPIHDPRTGDAARHRRRQRAGDDAAPGDHRAGRDRRAARRVPAVAAPRAAARAAAAGGGAGARRRCAGPLLLVDDHGWVAHTSGIAAQARIAVPQRRPAAEPCPGSGCACPSRSATAGWSGRPARETRIAMTLDLTGAPGRRGARRAALAQRADRAARADPAAAGRAPGRPG